MDTKEFTDYSLWSVFVEDFDGFKLEDFKRIPTAPKQQLQIYLLQRGIYIKYNNWTYTLLQVLLNTLKEYNCHRWTDIDIINALKEV